MMDIALKQRLIGASILIALAVIFIPMLFDETVETGEVTSDLAIPPAPPAPELQTRTFAAHPGADATPRESASPPADSRALDSTAGETTGRETIQTPVIVPLTPLYPPPETDTVSAGEPVAESSTVDSAADSAASETAPAAPAATKPAPPTESPEAGGGPWQVQAASFASSNNAERLASQLEELGYRTRIDTVFRADQPLHRVRAVGFAGERDAAAAARRITDDLPRLRPRVVAPEGESTKTPAASGAPVQRFAVQLGVFSDADNAGRLLEKVRAADFAAFVEQQQRPEGRVQVVKVGPLLSRDDAADVRRRLSETLAIDGLIVEYN